MPFFRCTICECGGDPIAQDVMVTLGETERDNWFGTITAEHLTTLTAGERYSLTLEDGRTGEFLVQRNTMAGHEDRAIAIRGAGLLA